MNDATAITAYKVALAAAVGEGASWAGGIEEFALASVGGVGVGLVLMVPIHWLRTHLKEALLQNTLSLLIPFVAYAAAEQVGASGVLAVVVVALYLGHRAWQVDFATRLQEEAVWKMVAFILESVGLRADRAAAAVRGRRAWAGTASARRSGTRSGSSWPWWWCGSSGSSRRRSCRACCRGGSGSASRTPTGRRR